MWRVRYITLRVKKRPDWVLAVTPGLGCVPLLSCLCVTSPAQMERPREATTVEVWPRCLESHHMPTPSFSASFPGWKWVYGRVNCWPTTSCKLACMLIPTDKQISMASFYGWQWRCFKPECKHRQPTFNTATRSILKKIPDQLHGHAHRVDRAALRINLIEATAKRL